MKFSTPNWTKDQWAGRISQVLILFLMIDLALRVYFQIQSSSLVMLLLKAYFLHWVYRHTWKKEKQLNKGQWLFVAFLWTVVTGIPQLILYYVFV